MLNHVSYNMDPSTAVYRKLTRSYVLPWKYIYTHMES